MMEYQTGFARQRGKLLFGGGLNGTGCSEDTFPRGEGAPVRTLGRMRNGDAVGR